MAKKVSPLPDSGLTTGKNAGLTSEQKASRATGTAKAGTGRIRLIAGDRKGGLGKGVLDAVAARDRLSPQFKTGDMTQEQFSRPVQGPAYVSNMQNNRGSSPEQLASIRSGKRSRQKRGEVRGVGNSAKDTDYSLQGGRNNPMFSQDTAVALAAHKDWVNSRPASDKVVHETDAPTVKPVRTPSRGAKDPDVNGKTTKVAKPKKAPGSGKSMLSVVDRVDSILTPK